MQNSVNYYKLNLGGEGFSRIIFVEIFDTSEKGYVIVPHPISDVSKIYFKNDSGLATTLSIYSSNGVLTSVETTNSNFFEINKLSLSMGSYLFTLTSEIDSEIIYGKMVVGN
jgi:hypothetical protein